MIALMRFLLLGFLCLNTTICHVNAAPELQAYSVHPHDFKKAEKQIRPLLSSEGNLILDQSQRRLLVVDVPEVHEKIGKLYQPWAPTPKNIRIQVSSDSKQAIISDGYSVTGSGRVGNVGIQAGRSGPLQGKIRAIETQNNLNIMQQILVMSGGKGYIKIAEEVPEIIWFAQWGAQYDVLTSYTEWKDIGTQMIVEPFALPNGLIRVRLTPSFSYLLNNQRATQEIQQLSTEVTVADGAEIDLGGINLADKEFAQRFLTSRDSFGSSRRVSIKLRATIEDIGSKPKYIELN
jgi:type II secretory pathway component GspD/PulD (secretin)